MIQIIDKQNCAGCTACMAACPKNAISMVEDEQGFMYPSVDVAKCIDCGICNKVCHFDKPVSQPQLCCAYAVKHIDRAVLKNSTSGGFFTAASDYVLGRGGIVYGAALDKNMVVRHIRATTAQERDRMRGSKYVQSELADTFLQVKNDLLNQKTVLFTGTPCQIAGLKSFLKGTYEGLICLDLICHGVPSPMIFREHIRFLSEKIGTRITDYKFRPKQWGWHIHREIVCGERRSYHSGPYTDLWRTIYYSRVVTRPSCNHCPYSSLNRCGDISIGDCRGIDNVLTEFGSNEGVTLAIVNTEKGKEFFERISESFTFEALAIEDVLQPPLVHPSQPNRSAEQFFSIYREYGYKKAILLRFGRLYPLKYYIKRLLRRN